MNRLRPKDHRRFSMLGGARYRDPVRERFITATPEEEVRQDVVACLVADYGYPLTSIRTEEPIGRGTDNRDRADVLVVLPRRPSTVEVIPADQTAASSHVKYSERQRLVEELVVPGAVWFPPVPDLMRVRVGGVDRELAVRGFVRVPAGHALHLQTPSDLLTEGYPPILAIQVNGYGLTSEELEQSKRLSIGPCEWFLEGFPADPGASAKEREALRVLSWTTLADNEHAWLLLYPDPMPDDYAVIAKAAAIADEVSREQGARDVVAVTDLQASSDPTGDATVIVVECKARHVALTAEVFEQGLRYARVTNATFLVITNGSQAQTFRLGHGESERVELPTYQEILRDGTLRVAAAADRTEPNVPLPASLSPEMARWHARACPWQIGYEVQPQYLAPLLRLNDFLFAGHALFTEPVEVDGVELVADLGNAVHEPGSPMGTWPGLYRDLLVREVEREYTVSMALLASCEVPVKGMAAKILLKPMATTYLNVALADGAQVESALEMNVLKHGKVQNGRLILTHDASMTVGKGALTRRRVKEYVAANGRGLLRDGTIQLGEIDGARPATWSTVSSLVARLIRYARLRADLKRLVRAERKAV